MKKKLITLSFLFLTGCGGFADMQSTVIEVSGKEEVRGCKLLESFEGPSGYRIWGPPMVIGSFKSEAIRKAEKIGATHILWRNRIIWEDACCLRTKVGGLRETAFVDAYKCTATEGASGNDAEP